METQKIIITGGATRIGAAIAESLVSHKNQITIHYNKSKEKAEKLKKIIEKKGSKVFLIKADLNKISELNKIIKFANVKMKGVNCLINNASLFENDNIKNFSIKGWDKHININLKAPAILIKQLDRKSVVQGKSVDLGGRRIIKKKKYKERRYSDHVRKKS